MTEPTNSCSLLDLPDAVLESIVTYLGEPDKESFMCVCRKAFELTLLTAEARLIISKGTKLKGISQVLHKLPAKIELHIWRPWCLPDDSDDDSEPGLALEMFMCEVPERHLAMIASMCRWETITTVFIEASTMGCLLPQFIALSCPQLTVAKLGNLPYPAPNLFTDTAEQALPLLTCTSLKKLHVNFRDHLVLYRLPPAYHSPAELRHSLPNIDTLNLGGFNVDLIEAFAAQLTCLYVIAELFNEKESDSAQQSMRRCPNLQVLHTTRGFLPDNAAVLNTVVWQSLSDKDMKKLLKLPSLTNLNVTDIDIKEDWSSHACSWQDLRVSALLRFTTLGKLCLSSLKSLTLSLNQAIELPHPSDPGSIAAVQRAADNLAGAGKIVVEHAEPATDTFFGKCGTIAWQIAEAVTNSEAETETDSDNEADAGVHLHEQKAASMLSIAAQRVGPVKVCNCEYILHQPLILDAALNWGKTFLESVCLGNNFNPPPPHVWQALQRLDRLNTVAFWFIRSEADDYREHAGSKLHTSTEILNGEKLAIVNTFGSAAEQYVIPTKKSLRMEFNQSWEAAYTPGEGNEFIRVGLQRVLPAGCQLSSIHRHCMPIIYPDTRYGGRCESNSFWVLELKPS